MILTLRSATQEVEERLAHDPFAERWNRGAKGSTMVGMILTEVGEVVAKHKAWSAEWYNEVGSRASALHNPAAVFTCDTISSSDQSFWAHQFGESGIFFAPQLTGVYRKPSMAT